MNRIPLWLKALSGLAVAVVVVLGIWLSGAVLTQDATVAMILTGAFLTAVGAVVAGLCWRWRRGQWRGLVWPVLLTYVVVAGGLGGWLVVTSNRDVVVSEAVTRVSPDASPAPSAAASTAPSEPSNATPGPAQPTAAVEVARGTFVTGAHDTSGTAAVVQKPDGSRVLTITALDTDPGPDLRVYLVPGDGTDVAGAVDLGALKGNRGDQEYDVPAGAPIGAVVVWCRAFSVGFGHAPLTPA